MRLPIIYALIVTGMLTFEVYSHDEHEGSGRAAESCPQMEVLRGRDGRDGRDGVGGPAGEKGERGLEGNNGIPGTAGPRGRVGEKGEQGNQGQRGITGPGGPQGPQGSQGPVGPKGDRGSQGVMGSPGQQGSPGRSTRPADCNCVTTYVRWGRTTCPGNISTELVYSGRAGGSWWNNTGGATNYLCMPDNPDYLRYDSRVQGYNFVYGVEYDIGIGQPFFTHEKNVWGHNVPCAVCMAVSRCSMIMIPAKTQCPSSWTTEYVGYLMSASHSHTLPTRYECADKDPESVPGLNALRWYSGCGPFDHVEIKCNGMKCPPYVAGRELTCVVCTR